MTKLSPEQIARYAHGAGFRGDDLTTAVAIALAESGGDTRTHNSVPPDDSYGLWQINMLGALGPARRHEFGLDADRELFDPKTNAAAAYDVSGRGASFEPWSTYTSGDYKHHLAAARKGVHAYQHDHRHAAHKDHKDPKGGKDHKGQGGKDGFLVDPDALSGYARKARTIADELTALRTHELHKVRALAGDSFGRIGKETGFADALDHFGESLRQQVHGVARNADALARSVSKTAHQYDTQEHDLTSRLLDLLGDKP